MPCPSWRGGVPEAEALCSGAARAALDAVAPGLAAAELSIVLGDDALVAALNRRWRGREGPTNVLSFASGDKPAPPLPLLLGDVVLAYETVAAEAMAQAKPLTDHLRHLIVHGVLHLLGFDHIDNDEAERMEALETRILAGLGVSDPYRMREATHG